MDSHQRTVCCISADGICLCLISGYHQRKCSRGISRQSAVACHKQEGSRGISGYHQQKCSRGISEQSAEACHKREGSRGISGQASADSQQRPAISEKAAEASAERQTIDHSAPCRKYICFTLSTYIVITIYFLGV